MEFQLKLLLMYIEFLITSVTKIGVLKYSINNTVSCILERRMINESDI